MAWTSANGEDIDDPSAVIFALSNQLKSYRPGDPKKAGCNHRDMGPRFNAMGTNGDNRGTCKTKSHEWGQYNVDEDEYGNCVLTGEGAGQEGAKDFTLLELEVFLVE